MHIGEHILIDAYGIEPDTLLDEQKLTDILVSAAEAAGATVLQCHTHKFGGGEGVSVVVIIAESHLSIHTYPEYGIAMADVFTCGGQTFAEAAVDYIITQLKPETVNLHCHKRGMLSGGDGKH